MVLDTKGGPNWFKNWCIAPVIVNPDTDEVYFTPLYYTMVHFSKFIRPGAEVIGVDKTDNDLLVSASKNTDGSIAIVVFNESLDKKSFVLNVDNTLKAITINAQAIQTIMIN